MDFLQHSRHIRVPAGNIMTQGSVPCGRRVQVAHGLQTDVLRKRLVRGNMPGICDHSGADNSGFQFLCSHKYPPCVRLFMFVKAIFCFFPASFPEFYNLAFYLRIWYTFAIPVRRTVITICLCLSLSSSVTPFTIHPTGFRRSLPDSGTPRQKTGTILQSISTAWAPSASCGWSRAFRSS